MESNCCNRATAAAPESSLDERAEVRASVATVCIDEVDLDSWWDEQDVEIKAEIFLLWSLGSGSVASGERAIVVQGTVPSYEVHVTNCASDPKFVQDVLRKHASVICDTVRERMRTAVRQGDGDGSPDLAAGAMADELHGRRK